MASMFETVLHPGVRLMQRLRLQAKFLLISAAFIVPLGVTLYAVISYANAGISFASNELQGTAYLQRLHPLLTRATVAGSDLSALQQQITQDKDVFKVQAAVNALASSGQALNDQLINLYATIGDNSSLILDPDLDSFYTMAVTVDYGPKLIAASKALGLRLASGANDPTAAADIRYLESRVKDLQNSLQQAVQRATQANTSLTARLDTTQWQRSLQALLSATTAMLAGQSSASNQVSSVTAAANEQTLQLITDHLSVLTELLQHRIDAFAARRNWILLLTLSCLVLSGYLISSFYLCDRRGFEALETRMKKLARGDLTSNSPARGDDEIGALINAFNDSRAQLQVLVERIHHAASTISTAGQEIAAANMDLAQRGSAQSAVIGETAERIKHITEKVHANLDSSGNASHIAEAAFASAGRGKSVVDSVVQTMDTMTGSSKRIGAIIDVINEIAFQTNLLALNAAVEAARAGEQGRGFAVVAGEVRNLAQRCAKAANEITHLIKASVNDVDKGVGQVAKTGTSMDEILAAVRSVSHIMAEVARASKTQAEAIAVVDKAIGRIDGDAQQNAALVEQTAAAAELLREQVAVLMESVSHFTLGSEIAAAPHPQSLRADSHGAAPPLRHVA